MPTAAYRAYVAEQSQRRPSQIFDNRSQEHAAVVIEYLFGGANEWIHFVTSNVNPNVYGQPTVIDAARGMLSRNGNSRIIILAESPVERNTHPFFRALDSDPTVGNRVKLHFVPREAVARYKFNFGVNDLSDYRYEELREKHDATVQFGGLEFAQSLESTFQELLLSTQPAG